MLLYIYTLQGKVLISSDAAISERKDEVKALDNSQST